jgi:hypothetical protein
MRNQFSSPRRRVLPPSLRFHYSPTQSHGCYPNQVQWSEIWIAAIVFALVLLGAIPATVLLGH